MTTSSDRGTAPGTEPVTLATLEDRIERTRISRDGWTLAIFAIAAIALIISVVGIGFARRAVDQNGGDSMATASVPDTEVELSEFAIEPEVIEVAAGGGLQVENGGSAVHNLSIEGTDLITPDLEAGGSARLDLASLEPGTYKVICAVPGHEGAGMTGELRVTDSGATADQAGAAPHEGHAVAEGGGAMTPEEVEAMDEAMAERTLAFPAETEGKGGQVLEPTVLPDGTKQFELTTSIVDWEVEPGKVVEAWAYNGQVPGPTLHVNTGDKVRVVLNNELPESTSIHWHGLLVPNAMDGVPDLTQEPVKPGESFTYDFVARETAVGMYHSHHNAAKQVPNGLAGTVLVDRLPMPDGKPVDVEHTMMLNDAGTIGYSLNGKSFPATEPLVVARGQRVLVHYLNEGLVSHPMHLHGMHVTVVAKDGVPLPAPYRADTIDVAPGERYSVLVEATEPGTWAWHCHILTHAESDQGMFGMVTAMVVE